MTRKEAVEELYRIIENQYRSAEKDKEALDIAIKALEQESKPMIEIDLYSVIKQKYIAREVLDKIRADVINIADNRRSIPVRSVINIIDKFKAESEEK